MDGTLAIVLLVVSLGLLLAEVFTPSGGLILVTAVVALIGSIWLAWRAWSEEPALLWGYFGTVVVIIPTVVGLLLYWFPRTSWGKRILLDAPPLEEVTGYHDEVEQLQQFVGKRGTSLTLMNPGGMVLVDGERHHAESRGLLIEPQQPIEVVGVSGNRLVVRQISPEESAEAPPVSAEQTPSSPSRENRKNEVAGNSPLDFEVPRS